MWIRRSSTSCSGPQGQADPGRVRLPGPDDRARVRVDERPPARRRVGQERLPVPALVLAIVAIALLRAARSSGCCGRRRGATSGRSSRRTARSPRCGCRCGARSGRRSFAVLFGVPLAWLLARDRPFRAGALVRALCTLSMVLPPVVAGVALFYALGRRGLVGQYLDRWFGFTLPFTTRGCDRRPDVRGDAVPRDHRRGGLPPARHPLRGRRPHARRLALVRVPPGDVAGHPSRARSPAPCSRGPARSASSARPSRSPATSPAAPRRCRSPSTSPTRPIPDEAIVLSLVLIARLLRRARRAARSVPGRAATHRRA